MQRIIIPFISSTRLSIKVVQCHSNKKKTQTVTKTRFLLNFKNKHFISEKEPRIFYQVVVQNVPTEQNKKEMNFESMQFDG